MILRVMNVGQSGELCGINIQGHLSIMDLYLCKPNNEKTVDLTLSGALYMEPSGAPCHRRGRYEKKNLCGINLVLFIIFVFLCNTIVACFGN